MYYIGEGIELNYLEAQEKFNLDDLINKKRFTVIDTTLTNRQVNTLDEDGLLNDDRKDKKSWRKFSLKELVYLLLVGELKKFGLSHNQLRELSKYFLNKDYSYLSNLAIGCVLGHIEIIITLDSEGKVDIFDPNFYTLVETKTPYIKIVLNDYVNKVAVKLGKSPFPIKWSVEKVTHESKVLPKEEELLKIIRNADYSSITVKKKNGEIALVHAVKSHNPDISDNEASIMKLIKEHDFQDINLIRRNGKIVNYKIEEAIKL